MMQDSGCDDSRVSRKRLTVINFFKEQFAFKLNFTITKYQITVAF